MKKIFTKEDYSKLLDSKLLSPKTGLDVLRQAIQKRKNGNRVS